jgi:hypothetical protein
LVTLVSTGNCLESILKEAMTSLFHIPFCSSMYESNPGFSQLVRSFFWFENTRQRKLYLILVRHAYLQWLTPSWNYWLNPVCRWFQVMFRCDRNSSQPQNWIPQSTWFPVLLRQYGTAMFQAVRYWGVPSGIFPLVFPMKTL